MFLLVSLLLATPLNHTFQIFESSLLNSTLLFADEFTFIIDTWRNLASGLFLVFSLTLQDTCLGPVIIGDRKFGVLIFSYIAQRNEILIIIAETYPNYAESLIDKVDKCGRVFLCFHPRPPMSMCVNMIEPRAHWAFTVHVFNKLNVAI